MKQIPVSNGRAFALVDDEDYEELSKHVWHLRGGYASRHVEWPGKGDAWRHMPMHRQIMDISKDDKRYVDHVDRNRLNNQRSNLRICTPTGNAINRGLSAANKSGYKGVSWCKKLMKWRAQIQFSKKKIAIGFFDTAEDAYRAYCMKAKELHGEYAILEVRKVSEQIVDFVPYVKRTNKTGFKGVKYDPDGKKWSARIMRNGKRIELGRFATPEEAHAAYCSAAAELCSQQGKRALKKAA